jgi:hypothetical protein
LIAFIRDKVLERMRVWRGGWWKSFSIGLEEMGFRELKYF